MSDLLVTDYCWHDRDWKRRAWTYCFVNVLIWIVAAGWILSDGPRVVDLLPLAPAALPFFLNHTEEDPHLRELWSAAGAACAAALLAYLPWRESAGPRFWTALAVGAGLFTLHRHGPRRLRRLGIMLPVAASLLACAVWTKQASSQRVDLAQASTATWSTTEMSEFEHWLERRGFSSLAWHELPREISRRRSEHSGFRLEGDLGTTTVWLEYDWHGKWLAIHSFWEYDGPSWRQDEALASYEKLCATARTELAAE